jgi:hypothetical protein
MHFAWWSEAVTATIVEDSLVARAQGLRAVVQADADESECQRTLSPAIVDAIWKAPS